MSGSGGSEVRRGDAIFVTKVGALQLKRKYVARPADHKKRQDPLLDNCYICMAHRLTGRIRTSVDGSRSGRDLLSTK